MYRTNVMRQKTAWMGVNYGLEKNDKKKWRALKEMKQMK